MFRTISQSTMRIRGVYFNLLIKKASEQRDKVWNQICNEFLEDNNDLRSRNDIAFKFNTEIYPESFRLQRRTTVNRKSKDLHESLEEDFEVAFNKYVTEWNEVFRDFRNLLTTVFKHARTADELELVIPQTLLIDLDDVDYVALPKAKGITDELAKEIKAKYKLGLEINNYIAMGQLL
jgi:hypothetical protein